MKKITQLSLIVIALTFVLSSCTMQKRIYLSGYNVEWRKGIQKSDKQTFAEKKTNDAVKTKSENNVEPATILDQTQTSIADNAEANNDNLTASVGNSVIPINSTPSQQKEFSVITSSDECDNIVLKNGEEIKAKVTEITTDEIKYKKCDNLTGPSYSIKKSEVFMIRYSNGTKDIITSNNSAPSNTATYSNNVSDKTQKNTEEKKGGGFGITSFVLSIVGLLVAGVIFGPLAIIFGIIGMIKRKLKGLAIAGLIIGIIDIIAALIIIAAIL
ncbi:MAG: hypothetical protein WC868_03770 [Bacteroidales bacterium]